MKKILLSFIAILLFQFSYSQRQCATMDVLAEQIKNDPNIENRMMEIERFTENYIRSNNSNVRNALTIPVVVHVVYNRRSSSENISEAQILSQIQVLNEDFGRYNADRDNTWPQASATSVQFCMASVDPDGNPTNGITRTSSSKRSFGTNNAVKFDSQGGKDAWPSSDYMNVWVCNIGGGILGYAQFPGGSAATDGIVLDYRYTGTIGTATAPYDLGRTGTHEVGHWLNLRHIWGDGGCSVDDKINDTPESDGPNYTCTGVTVSCGTVDMIENYMDYTYDYCMNLFTAGQSLWMDGALAGSRASLFNSNGCGAPTEPTCTDGIQNGNETGVDCGGTCEPCPTEPTCNDGIQNGDETGVDCGGSCEPCPTEPTCTDGIQNGSETGVDCGGPDCAPCDTGITCEAPTGLTVDTYRKKNTQLSWNSASGAISYNVSYRVVGSSAWSTSNSTSTSANLRTEEGLDYEWLVTSVCSSSESDPSVTCTFTGNTNGSSACGGVRVTDRSSDIALYPNPAKDELNVDISEIKGENIKFRVINAAGQLVDIVTLQSGGVNTINISDYQHGLYILHAQLESGETISKRFVVIE